MGRGWYHVIDDADRVRHGARLKACGREAPDQLVDGDVAPGVVVEVDTFHFPSPCWGGVGGAEDSGGGGCWGCVDGVAIGAWV